MEWSFGPVGVLEMLWTFFGVGGSINVWTVMMASSSDKMFIEQKVREFLALPADEQLKRTRLRWQEREILGDMSHKTDMVLFGILASFAAFGIFTLTQEPAQGPGAAPSPSQIIFTILMMGVTVTINWLVYRRRNARDRINMIEIELDDDERRETWPTVEQCVSIYPELKGGDPHAGSAH